MEILIRLATSEDLDKIIEIQTNSLRVLTIPYYNSKQIESLILSQKKARFKNEIIFVADYDHKSIGFSSLLLNSHQIGGIYVSPDFIHQGVGSKLLKALEEAAVEKKYKVIFVSSSLSAISFYQVKGYKIVNKESFYSEGRILIPCVKMRKRLIDLTPKEKLIQRIFLLVLCLIVIISFLSVIF